MSTRTSACLLVCALFASLTAQAAPPVQSPLQAVARLRGASTGPQATTAVKAVNKACRGKLRHALRDHSGLLSAAVKMGQSKDPAVRTAALDLDRCFTPKTFIKVVQPRLSDPEPSVLIYAAEVAARLADPVVLPALHSAFDRTADRCLQDKLSKSQVEVCVWLTYAPGAALESADAAARAQAADRALKMFASPHAKVREVAVETVASARLSAHAAAIKQLIADEKAHKFAQPNTAALLSRFDKRRRALRKLK